VNILSSSEITDNLAPFGARNYSFNLQFAHVVTLETSSFDNEGFDSFMKWLDEDLT